MQSALVSEGVESRGDSGTVCIDGQSEGVREKFEDAADTLEKSGHGLAVAGIEVSWSGFQE